jgi:hypothetical protein
MAKFSMKKGGKEVGPAEVYAAPHTMDGKATNIVADSATKPGKDRINEMNISVGGVSKGNYAPINPYGVGVMRGYGAATKGRKISGKMG